MFFLQVINIVSLGFSLEGPPLLIAGVVDTLVVSVVADVECGMDGGVVWMSIVDCLVSVLAAGSPLTVSCWVEVDVGEVCCSVASVLVLVKPVVVVSRVGSVILSAEV